VRFSDIIFLKSVYKLSQLPLPEYPEIAFAGRSNVGKSSLLNRLFNRKKMVKVSSVPGKTQSLNFFQADQTFYLVDLPGYGFAKVPKKMQAEWRHLVTSYLETRESLRCVVVIIDIRHSLKTLDLELISWLQSNNIAALPVYTKLDKLSGNERRKMPAMLDAGLNITPADRILFSARTGEGRDELRGRIAKFLS